MLPLPTRTSRCLALGGLAFACTIGWSGSAAGGAPYRLSLAESGHRIVYASCGDGEESEECASHELFCGAEGFGITILGTGEEGRDTRAIARALIAAPWGEASLSFRVAGEEVAVPVASVELALNEMNGDWDVTLRSFDGSAFFSVLREATARGSVADIAGLALPLAPRRADAAKLMAFRKACEA